MKISGHILIIDDEASLRKTLARILQQAGFEVTTAENGEQGLSFLQGANFDLVYTDLRMPGLHRKRRVVVLAVFGEQRSQQEFVAGLPGLFVVVHEALHQRVGHCLLLCLNEFTWSRAAPCPARPGHTHYFPFSRGSSRGL